MLIPCHSNRRSDCWRWFAVLIGVVGAASTTVAEDESPPDFVGIEIGPGIINAVQKRKRIGDWSQREIDAYYQVLKLARETPYAEQRKKADANFQAEIDRYRDEVEQTYQKRLKAIEDAGDNLNPFEKARQNSFGISA